MMIEFIQADPATGLYQGKVMIAMDKIVVAAPTKVEGVPCLKLFCDFGLSVLIADNPETREKLLHRQ